MTTGQKDRFGRDEIMAVIRKSFSGGLSADEEILLEEWLGSDEENGREYSFLKSLYMWKNPPFAPDEVDDGRMPWRIRRLLLKNSIGTNVFVRAYRIVACLLLIPLAGVLVWALTDRPSDQDSVAMQEVRAPFGICSAVTLPDGSEVVLNAGSSLRFPSGFDGTSRAVELSGEAYFEVESCPDRPFIVRTGGLDIVATGTSFNVEAYSGEDMIAVTMVEGEVGLYAPDDRFVRTMMAEDRLVYSRNTGTVDETAGYSYRYISWKDGVLAFRNDPLDSILARLGRLYNVEFILMDESLAHKQFYATFNNESLESILKLLSMSDNVRFEQVSGTGAGSDHGIRKIYVMNREKH